MGISPEKKKVRSSNELELIKLILEENSDLKKKVLKLIEKSLGKTSSITSKSKKGKND